MTAVARGQRAIIRLMQDDPEASYSADDLGGEGAALTGLVIAGKITKSGRGSAARYMLAEDVAVGEQPDEVVPVPPEEEEEEEELPEPFDAKAAEKAVRAWVSAANNGRFIEVDTSACVSRYQRPKGDWPVTVKTLDNRSALARRVHEHEELSGYITDVTTALLPHKFGRAVTTEDYYNRSYSPSIIYVTAALNANGELLGLYFGQKCVHKLLKLLGRYCGGFRLPSARRVFLDAPTLLVRPLIIVKGGNQASLCEALAYTTGFYRARSLGRADAIFFQGAPVGAKMALTSAAALKDIERLPARHPLRLAAAKAKKDPNYVVPVSTATEEEMSEKRSAAAAKGWRDMQPKKKKKLLEKKVGSCVELKFRAPHSIDAALSPA